MWVYRPNSVATGVLWEQTRHAVHLIETIYRCYLLFINDFIRIVPYVIPLGSLESPWKYAIEVPVSLRLCSLELSRVRPREAPCPTTTEDEFNCLVSADFDK